MRTLLMVIAASVVSFLAARADIVIQQANGQFAIMATDDTGSGASTIHTIKVVCQ